MRQELSMPCAHASQTAQITPDSFIGLAVGLSLPARACRAKELAVCGLGSRTHNYYTSSESERSQVGAGGHSSEEGDPHLHTHTIPPHIIHR